MTKSIPQFQLPELIFGFVAPIGADLRPSLSSFQSYLERCGYKVEEVKVTRTFQYFEKVVPPIIPLEHKKTKERYDSHIKYGNQLRRHFGDDSILAYASIAKIQKLRIKHAGQVQPYQGVAYLVHQFKRKEEIELLRTVYGPSFFQISVYSRRGTRVDYLSRKFAASRNSVEIESYRADAENIVGVDEREKNEHGQQVAQIFHDADFIINHDVSTPAPSDQIDRFCDLIFGSNSLSPTHMEYGMFLAKAAALRTLDLSRQVGAAIFSAEGEIITLGSNEVPKAGGGTYWSDERYDDREYKRKVDSNEERKKQIQRSILEQLFSESDVDEKMSLLRDSQLMDALEYGRIIHAEMSAISDAARLGRAIRGSVLFSTTFPCHLCAKHIVAAGVSKVVFLEPYPKSLASRLHADSICVEGADRGSYDEFPSVKFEHFFGVTPRRYRELFARSKRKDKDGNFQEYSGGIKKPILDIRAPSYPLERVVVDHLKKISLEAYDGLQSDPS